MDGDFEKLAERIYKNLPEKTREKARLEIPEIESVVVGRKTTWKNFSAIAKTLKRKESHLYKFFTKETGLPATLEGGNLVFSGRVSNSRLKDLFKRYLKEFVICKECGKLDTHFTTELGIKMIKCQACGAINPVRRI